MTTYYIMRYFRKEGRKPREIAKTDSLEEAREYCQRDDTHGADWFDGYTQQVPDHPYYMGV